MILGGLLGSLFGDLVVKVFIRQFVYTNKFIESIYFAIITASLFYILVFIFALHFEVSDFGLDECTLQNQNLPKTITARNGYLN